MAKLTIRSAGVPHVKRLQDGETIVALISQFSNGRWGLFDTQDRRLTPGELYPSPISARRAFEALTPPPATGSDEEVGA